MSPTGRARMLDSMRRNCTLSTHLNGRWWVGRARDYWRYSDAHWPVLGVREGVEASQLRPRLQRCPIGKKNSSIWVEAMRKEDNGGGSGRRRRQRRRRWERRGAGGESVKLPGALRAAYYEWSLPRDEPDCLSSHTVVPRAPPPYAAAGHAEHPAEGVCAAAAVGGASRGRGQREPCKKWRQLSRCAFNV